ncbi:lysosome membrane protein 2-like [Gigantopelta aegis]|uniref:lysosome membrane protein 2-like n=1 Tax=Gigantopelta aegis TaxID=1735272 RepID=UPI001B887928|nr:lysosome membrane protein 2-like [Gigantopelta aegis]
MAKKSLICSIVCGVLGVILVVIGCVLIHVFKQMIHTQIKEHIPLKNGSDTYEDWVVPPAPIYFQVWVFNVVNPDEIIKNGAIPVLEERGPYTYREYRTKKKIDFIEKNATVTYMEDRAYVFDRNMSCGPETDRFTTLNILLVTVLNMIRFEYGAVKEAFQIFLDLFPNVHMFLSLSVHDVLWGYEDPLIKDLEDFIFNWTHKTIPFDDHVGLFYKKNGTDDGIYNIYTGSDDVDKFGVIATWNYNSSLNWWSTPYANMLNGSDGTLFPPFVDSSRPLYLYASDVCRSLEIVYKYGYKLKDIDLLRYVVPPSSFRNVTSNPDNIGFCTPFANLSDTSDCNPGGVLNASVCKQDAPFLFSSPHFLFADDSVLYGVKGMHPSLEKHQTFLDVEPMTGVVMNAAKKLQLNFNIQKIDNITETLQIKKPIIFPMMWLNENAKIDDKSANKFKSEVMGPIKITEAVQYGLITLGVFIIVCVLAIGLKRLLCKRSDSHSPLESLQEEKQPLLQ